MTPAPDATNPASQEYGALANTFLPLAAKLARESHRNGIASTCEAAAAAIRDLEAMADERPGKAVILRRAAALLRREPSVEEVAEAFYTARVGAAGFNPFRVTEVPWNDLPECFKDEYRQAAQAVAALWGREPG